MWYTAVRAVQGDDVAHGGNVYEEHIGHMGEHGSTDHEVNGCYVKVKAMWK